MTNLVESFRQKSEEYGSDGFRLEYAPDTPREVVYKNLESLLGEYVFEVPKYDYLLGYKDGKLIEPVTNETWISKTLKTIDSKKNEGKNTSREEADLEGFVRLEKRLINAPVGTTIVWMSPPGPKKEGYGDWGFVYVGEIGDEGRILMKALRVEKPRLLDYSLFYALISNDPFNPVIEEDFIAHPLVISDLNVQQIRSLITGFFIQKDAQNNSIFYQAMHELSPYIDKYLKILKRGGSKAFEQQAFNALLNYSLDLKDRLEEGRSDEIPQSFSSVFERYAYRVPPLAGSCGSIGSSNDIFNSLSPLSKILNPENKIHWDYHNGTCVVCNKKNAEVGPCNICKECEKNFD